jgi:hypothetical protein
MKNLALAATLLAAILIPSHGQGKSRSISARILCLQHQQGIDSVRFGTGPENLGEAERLLIGDYSLPFPVEIMDNSLLVFKDASAADATPIAATKIPADATNVTLLFVPGTDTPYRIVPIPDASSDFKADHTRFINLAPIPVRFRIEDQLVDLPPGKLQRLSSLPKRDNFNMANVAMASLINQEWKVVSQTQWHFVAGNRLLVLVYVRPGTQRLVSLSFKDRPGSEKTSKVAPTP